MNLEGIIDMNLAQNIKRFRKERKISQHELAEQAGINPNHLSRLETGKFYPTIPVLKKIAEVLDVPIEYLIKEGDGELPEIKIKNKSLMEKVRLIDSLDEDDQMVITKMIDTMLTKAKMKALLNENQI